MTPAMILEALLAVMRAAPELLALYQKATSGQPVGDADVQSVLTKCGVDRAVFVAAIAASEAQGK